MFKPLKALEVKDSLIYKLLNEEGKEFINNVININNQTDIENNFKYLRFITLTLIFLFIILIFFIFILL